jgi:SAM-dependent methyltransferase
MHRLVFAQPRTTYSWLQNGEVVATLKIVGILLILAAAFVLLSLGWRWASRRWSIPCPSILAWSLENRFFQRFNGTRVVLDRLGFQPGQKVLEIGPGPGRLLIPAAKQVLPGGEAVGIDIQPKMIERLKRRANDAGITNLQAIVGDATNPHVPEASFDIVFLCTALGEIPDRTAALAQCYRALKPEGVLSITEMFGDPHYQTRSVVLRLAEVVGFRFQSVEGGWWLYTAQFVKPSFFTLPPPPDDLPNHENDEADFRFGSWWLQPHGLKSLMTNNG